MFGHVYRQQMPTVEFFPKVYRELAWAYKLERTYKGPFTDDNGTELCEL